MELSLLKPELERGKYHFGGREIRDFQAIAQLKQWGFAVKEIQKLFEHKQSSGCGTEGLLQYARDLLQGRVQTIDSEMAQLMRQKEQVLENLAEVNQVLKETVKNGCDDARGPERNCP
ncbi:hypothetical protein D3C73_1425830 [compost metagenome]